MMRSRFWLLVAVLLLLFGVAVSVFTLLAYRSARRAIAESIAEVPQAPVALVLGASVQPDKRASGVLRDRVRAAVELLQAGHVKKLLLSGDNREAHYNEVAAMRREALALGAPPEALVLDFAGRRTYDSCLRAREVFGVRSLVIVTQRFHLARAIYLCTKLGLRVSGLPADGPGYDPPLKLVLREAAAWVLALIEIHVDEPRTVLGPPIPIDAEDTF